MQTAVRCGAREKRVEKVLGPDIHAWGCRVETAGTTDGVVSYDESIPRTIVGVCCKLESCFFPVASDGM